MNTDTAKARVSGIIAQAKAAITAIPNPEPRKPAQPETPPRPLIFAGDDPSPCVKSGHKASRPNQRAFEKLGYYHPYCTTCGVRLPRREAYSPGERHE